MIEQGWNGIAAVFVRLFDWLNRPSRLERELADARQRTAAVRRELNRLRHEHKRQIRAAYEPTRVASCTKLRYTEWATAERNAFEMAALHPGETFNVYECRHCPIPPRAACRYYHVGHTVAVDAPGSITATDISVRYGCGCEFTPDGMLVQDCDTHAEGAGPGA